MKRHKKHKNKMRREENWKATIDDEYRSAYFALFVRFCG